MERGASDISDCESHTEHANGRRAGGVRRTSTMTRKRGRARGELALERSVKLRLQAPPAAVAAARASYCASRSAFAAKASAAAIASRAPKRIFGGRDLSEVLEGASRRVQFDERMLVCATIACMAGLRSVAELMWFVYGPMRQHRRIGHTQRTHPYRNYPMPRRDCSLFKSPMYFYPPRPEYMRDAYRDVERMSWFSGNSFTSRMFFGSHEAREGVFMILNEAADVGWDEVLVKLWMMFKGSTMWYGDNCDHTTCTYGMSGRYGVRGCCVLHRRVVQVLFLPLAFVTARYSAPCMGWADARPRCPATAGRTQPIPHACRRHRCSAVCCGPQAIALLLVGNRLNMPWFSSLVRTHVVPLGLWGGSSVVLRAPECAARAEVIGTRTLPALVPSYAEIRGSRGDEQETWLGVRDGLGQLWGQHVSINPDGCAGLLFTPPEGTGLRGRLATTSFPSTESTTNEYGYRGFRRSGYDAITVTGPPPYTWAAILEFDGDVVHLVPGSVHAVKKTEPRHMTWPKWLRAQVLHAPECSGAIHDANNDLYTPLYAEEPEHHTRVLANSNWRDELRDAFPCSDADACAGISRVGAQPNFHRLDPFRDPAWRASLVAEISRYRHDAAPSLALERARAERLLRKRAEMPLYYGPGSPSVVQLIQRAWRRHGRGSARAHAAFELHWTCASCWIARNVLLTAHHYGHMQCIVLVRNVCTLRLCFKALLTCVPTEVRISGEAIEFKPTHHRLPWYNNQGRFAPSFGFWQPLTRHEGDKAVVSQSFPRGALG